jgi:hypothetical protein
VCGSMVSFIEECQIVRGPQSRVEFRQKGRIVSFLHQHAVSSGISTEICAQSFAEFRPKDRIVSFLFLLAGPKNSVPKDKDKDKVKVKVKGDGSFRTPTWPPQGGLQARDQERLGGISTINH